MAEKLDLSAPFASASAAWPGTPPVLLVQGPTGSGKSALALMLAEALDGEIINADALQVYRDWRVLSARPEPSDCARAPHRLFGHVDAAERYSTGRWLTEAVQSLADARRRGKRAVIVGGTGLYFRALTQGLADIPAIPDEVRHALALRLAAIGAPGLHAELARADPESAARLQPGDTARVVRALEVFQAFGETLPSLQAKTTPVLAAAEWRGFALYPPRVALYDAINARFAGMLRHGALDEAQTLLARGLHPDLPAMKAVGAPPLFAHLRGEIDLAAAEEIGARDTRRYAKRQYTWIGNQIPDWTRIEATNPAERLRIALNTLEA